MARSGRHPDATSRSVLGGDYWGVALYLACGLLVAVVGAAALGPSRGADARPPVSAPPPDAPVAATPARTRADDSALDAWRAGLRRLCDDPALAALNLRPDCETGTVSLLNERFFTDNGTELREGARAALRVLVPAFLDALRSEPRAWELLGVIELRGHADPRAQRDPYRTNLVTSQSRALALLLYLTGEGALPERDRLDLQRLAVVSGASHSRPPPSCTAATAECYRLARRVEIRPGPRAEVFAATHR